MLAIGFLSLLSLGLVGMAASGGDDDDVAETSEQDLEVELGDVSIDYFPGNDDPETQEQINDFIEGIEADPNRPIEDVVNELHDFLDDLEGEESEETLGDDFNFTPGPGTDADIVAQVEDLVEELREVPGLEASDAADQISAFIDQLEAQADGQTDAPVETPETEETAVARPPIGDQFRDPLIIAELQDIADTEAREPVNLVTVTNSGNSEISDDLVLTENANSDFTGENSFSVDAPETTNNIDVGYDPVHTFDINYSEGTGSVTASLNSDIQGPDGEIVEQSETDIDSAGAERTITTTSALFTSSTDITLDIDFDQIGQHFSKIDLSNPNDSLTFNFVGDIPGNLHFITDEDEDREPGDNSSTTTIYVIHTPTNLVNVSESAIEAFKESDNGQITDGILVAEIYLGSDSVVTTSGGVEEGAYELEISNFVNDNPEITSNIAWTSEGAPIDAGGASVTEMEGGNTGTGFTEGVTNPFDLGAFFDT